MLISVVCNEPSQIAAGIAGCFTQCPKNVGYRHVFGTGAL
jgi:hypothetical protein